MGIAFQQATAIRQMPELREAPETFEYSAEICFHHPQGRAGLLLGINGSGNGYALIASAEKQCVHFMECKSRAVLIDRGMRRLPIKQETWYPLRARYDGSILRLWLNENPLDGEPWPKFEFALELPGRGAGLYLENGTAEVRGERLVRWTDEKPKVPTFTNPVLTGADPDILLHEGRYYIYNRVPNDPNSREDAYLLQNGEHAGLDRMGDANAIFRVAWSDDLVNWSPYQPVLYRDKSLLGAFCMSPNVFEYKGYFYLCGGALPGRGELPCVLCGGAFAHGAL